MLFDCHTHINLAAFADDHQDVISRALKAGIGLVNVGTQKDTSRWAVELAQMYPNNPVYATVGLHPTHTSKSYHDEQELGGGQAAKAFTSRGEVFDYEYYLSLAKDSKVVAIGECGLDYYRMEELKDDAAASAEYKQKQVLALKEQVRLAKEVKKALMLHCRPTKGSDDAYEDLLVLLQKSHTEDVPKILHFYVGSLEVTKKFLEAGYYFEFGGVITFTKDYDEVIRHIPLERILLETDAPYVAPAPHRGKRNEPAYIIEVAKKFAEIKNVTPEEVATQTTKTAKKIFGL